MKREAERSEVELRTGHPTPPVKREAERSEVELRTGHPTPPVKRRPQPNRQVAVATAGGQRGHDPAVADVPVELRTG